MRGFVGCILTGLLATQLTAAASNYENVDSYPVLHATEKLILTPVGLQIKGRVDTGARNSSMHAVNIKLIRKKDNDYVQFDAFDDNGNRYQLHEKLRYITEVTNTSGIAEKRYVIRTHLSIKNKQYRIDVNLKDRSNMQYKFLIGRDLIKKGNYVIKIV